jgi:transcriptional antiterminator NusG
MPNCSAASIYASQSWRTVRHLFEEIIEKLVAVRRGQKHEVERKVFPGYVLAKMELTDEAGALFI